MFLNEQRKTGNEGTKESIQEIKSMETPSCYDLKTTKISTMIVIQIDITNHSFCTKFFGYRKEQRCLLRNYEC